MSVDIDSSPLFLVGSESLCKTPNTRHDAHGSNPHSILSKNILMLPRARIMNLFQCRLKAIVGLRSLISVYIEVVILPAFV
jgi:hypothetical protein